MARHLTVLVVAAALMGCSSPDAGTTATTSPPATTTTPTVATTTVTTTTMVTTTTTRATTTSSTATAEGPGPFGAEEYLPPTTLDAPVAVLVHGGGWVTGHPSSTEPLGLALAERGMVVINASYRTLSNGGGYPATFDDVACAIRYARVRATELGAAEEVTLIGHSAGAHLAAAVALSEDAFGGDCPWDGTSTPTRLVGLAGIYRIDAVEPVMELLLGGTRQQVPHAWAAADPFQHLGAASGMAVTLIHGEDDGIVSSEASREFANELEAVGVEVDLNLVAGATHMGVLDPQLTADLIRN